MKLMSKKYIFVIFIFVAAFILRIPNLNTPFWVDEFSSAGQARLINTYGLNVFNQDEHYFEHHNITVYWLISIFFNILGESTTSARLPFVIIGSIVPIFVYIVSKKLFNNEKSAIGSTLLTTFSYFQITWSRQARSYMLQQLLILLSIYIYLTLLQPITTKKRNLLIILFVIISIIGLLTHATFILVLFSLSLHFILHNRDKFKRYVIQPYVLVFLIGIGTLLHFVGTTKQILERVILTYQNGLSNNIWYYHSFLWREHQLIVFLAVIGILYSFIIKKKETLLLVTIISSYLTFHLFLFPPYVSRYILPIFPLLLIFSAQSCTLLGETIAKKITSKEFQKPFELILPILIIIGIIANGDTFAIKPKQFYSVNKDMRDIALVDYDQVYSLIKNKSKGYEDETAIIDTWIDRSRWYLSPDYKNYYLFRWIKEEGLVNGLEKRSVFSINDNGEKYLEKSGNTLFIGELSDLEKAMQKYPRGFIWIDDTSLPADVIQYAEQNLKKELYLDHYYLDDNPYSIWPGTLYSWGIE